MESLEDRVQKTLNEWEEARQEASIIRNQYVASGPVTPLQVKFVFLTVS